MGALRNIKILKQTIKQQRRKRKEYNMVFIDLAKTFDTVSHNSTEKDLTRKEILDQVRGTITEMYNNAKTRISVGGKQLERLR